MTQEQIQALPEVPPAKTGKWIDVKGQVFGSWFVIAYIGGGKWKCRCRMCGQLKLKRSDGLRDDKNGVCSKCFLTKLRATHGHARGGRPSKTYFTWNAMLQRCENSKSKCFERYGGRGIKVCRRWHLFENFLKDMGAAPVGLTLERKDNDGDYTPKNCKWGTWKEQNRNKSTNRFVMINGAQLTCTEAAKVIGYEQAAISTMLNRAGIPKSAIPTLVPIDKYHYGHQRWVPC